MEFEKIKRIVIMSIGLIILSYALADIFISASQGLYPRSIFMALVAWLSYISVHYIETGRFIDPRKEEKQLPHSEKNWLMLILAAVFFCLGMSVGSVGVAKENLLLASLGAASLIMGYFIGHYEFTDLIV